MKICVTGGAGYVGSHAARALAEGGHEVVVYDNLCTGHREFAKFGSFVHGDIRDSRAFAACLREHKPDGVIHFAARSQVGESVRDPGMYFDNNVGGTLSILQAMRAEGVNAIVVSGSAAVYGQPEKMPIEEDSPLNPISPYGETKLIMEKMLADFAAAHGLRWISLRYFNAAGASPSGEIGEWHVPETHLIPRVMLSTMGKLPEVEVFGTDYPTPDGTCIRDYIHVDDLASAHVLAMEHLRGHKAGIPLNLGTEKGTSVREILEGVEKISGKNAPCRFKERRPGDPPRLVANAARAGDVLGWKPKKTLTQTLEDAWNFYDLHKNVF